MSIGYATRKAGFARITSASTFDRVATGSHRIQWLALAICVLSLIPNNADAGVIVPLLSEEAFAQSCTITETCGSLTGGETERNGEGADESSIGHGSPASTRHVAAHMAAFPPGCGAPVSGSGEYSGSVPTIFTFSNSGKAAGLPSTGRVAAEINLVLPMLAPSQLLDPPRVAA